MKYYIRILFCIGLSIVSYNAFAVTNCDNAKDLYSNAVSEIDSTQKIKLYQKAIQLCPNYAEARNNLADAYEKIGYIDKAQDEYKEAIRLNPKLSSALLSLGDINFKKENYSEAIDYYEKGLALSPDDETAQRNLSIAKQKYITKHAHKDSSNNILLASEILERLDPVKTMGVGGVHAGDGRIAFRNILFEFNSDKIKQESIVQLKEIGNALSSLARNSNTRFIIEGHTDNIGRDDFNKKLSERRAESVKIYLVKNYNILGEKLNVIGFGKTMPLDDNGSEGGRKNNRRVEIVREQ